jgi:hypothetical protein
LEVEWVPLDAGGGLVCSPASCIMLSKSRAPYDVSTLRPSQMLLPAFSTCAPDLPLPVYTRCKASCPDGYAPVLEACGESATCAFRRRMSPGYGSANASFVCAWNTESRTAKWVSDIALKCTPDLCSASIAGLSPGTFAADCSGGVFYGAICRQSCPATSLLVAAGGTRRRSVALPLRGCSGMLATHVHSASAGSWCARTHDIDVRRGSIGACWCRM